MRNIKAIAGILLVFILGSTSGTILTHMVDRARFEAYVSGGPGAREEEIVKRLSKKLDLDNRQLEQVRTIVHETHESIRQIRQQLHPQMETLIDQGQKRVSAVLRPDQREKFEKFIAERKEHRHPEGPSGH